MCGRISSLSGLVLSCAFLAACGGGGGGGAPLNVQPPPLPSPGDSGFLGDLAADETFEALASYVFFKVDGDGDLFNASFGHDDLDQGSTVTYNVNDESFSFAVNRPTPGFGLIETFAPADIDAGRSDASFTVYSKFDGDVVLILLNPEDPDFNLTYSTFGHWIDTKSTEGAVSRGHLVFGARTPVTNMPSTGKATYNGKTIGTLVHSVEDTVFTLEGDAQLLADFAAGTLDGDFTGLNKTNVSTNETSPWRDFTITATINGNVIDSRFIAAAQTKDGVLTGVASGGFFGPNAEEVGGTYRLIGGGEGAVGAFLAKQ